jgi:hypothetical protein
MPAPLAGFVLGAALRTAAQKTTYRVAGKALAKKAVKKTAKANARGLKAAQKPTNRTGTKADRAQRAELQGNSNLIKNASPARANRTRGGSLAAQKEYGGFGVATAKRTPAQTARQAEITKELNPVRSVRKKAAAPARKKAAVAAPKSAVTVRKASSSTDSVLNRIRTLEGTTRQAAALKKAEEIRKAKATQRLLDIKNNKKFK